MLNHLLAFHLLLALLVQLIDSKTSCSRVNGESINLFSCRGCTVVIGCALHKPSTDPVWSCNGKPIKKDSDRIQIAEKNKFNLQISNLAKSDTGKYCCVAISRNVSEFYCASLEIIGKYMKENISVLIYKYFLQYNVYSFLQTKLASVVFNHKSGIIEAIFVTITFSIKT